MTVLAALLLPVWATVLGFGSALGRRRGAPGARRTRPERTRARLSRGTRGARPSGRAYAPPAARTALRCRPRAAAPPLPGCRMDAASRCPRPPDPAPRRRGIRSAAGAAAARAARRAPARRPMGGLGLRRLDEFTDEVTGASPAPAPISAVPVAPPAPITAWPRARGSGPARAMRVAAVADRRRCRPSPGCRRLPPPALSDEPWAPVRSPMSEPEAFPETSGRSRPSPARRLPGVRARLAPRCRRSTCFPRSPTRRSRRRSSRSVAGTLVAGRLPPAPPSRSAPRSSSSGGDPVRRPAAYPDAQLVAIQDGTVSKTHARLELREDDW